MTNIGRARDQAAWAAEQDQETFTRSDVYHGSEIRRLWESMRDRLFLTWSLWWGTLKASLVALMELADGAAPAKGLSHSAMTLWACLLRTEELPLCMRCVFAT
jgi:hypothetical protein